MGGNAEHDVDHFRLARQVAVAYAAVALAWIAGSDVVLAATTGADADVIVGSLVKGSAFVLVTATVLWAMLRRRAVLLTDERRRTRAALGRFEAVVANTFDVVVMTDAGGCVTFVDPAFEEVLGWPADAVIGRPLVSAVHPDDVAALTEVLASARRDGRDAARVRWLAGDGRWHHVEVAASSTGGDAGELVVNGRDVTELVQAAERHERMRTVDALTGLANRTTLERAVVDAGLAADGSERRLLVVVVDLVSFKRANEATGRPGGDAMLVEMGIRLRSCVPDAVVAARCGGDEFALAVALDDDDGIDGRVQALVEQIRDHLGRPIRWGSQRFRFDLTIGAALAAPGGDPSRLLLAAEEQLARARSRPDRTAIATMAARGAAPSRGPSLVAELSEALDDGTLEVHFQPQYALADGRATGVEALLRWRHSERGLLPPSEFLTEATTSALMPRVTRFVLTETLAAARRWHADGHPVRASVNLSLADLSRRTLAAEIAEVVDAAGLPAGTLALELTEQAILVEPERSIRTMRTLREHGIRFSIDDFGTGFSSMSHLSLLPVDELKIDRSFIDGVGRDWRREAIVRSTIELGQRLQLEVVAEGVEELASWERLRSWGCDAAQGYLMCRPLPFGGLDARSWRFAPTLDPTATR